MQLEVADPRRRQIEVRGGLDQFGNGVDRIRAAGLRSVATELQGAAA